MLDANLGTDTYARRFKPRKKKVGTSRCGLVPTTVNGNGLDLQIGREWLFQKQSSRVEPYRGSGEYYGFHVTARFQLSHESRMQDCKLFFSVPSSLFLLFGVSAYKGSLTLDVHVVG